MSETDLPDPLLADLQRAVGRHLPGSTVTEVERIAGGRSALTLAATLAGPGGRARKVAVRAVRPDADTLSIASLGDQFVLLERMVESGVPAPRPRLVEEGSAGSTYDLLVTDFASGSVPSPWRSSGRAEIAELGADPGFLTDFVDVLARIHAVPAETLPAGIRWDGSSAAASHPARSLGRSSSSVDASPLFRADPVLTYTRIWLARHRPDQQFASGLVHGDYRMGNIVVDHGRIAAVVDWELSEAGETLSDVAWLCGPQGLVGGRPAGLFSEEQLVTAYEKATGRHVDANLFDYLKVEGTLRTAAVWTQLSIDELARGDTTTAARCRDSVLDLIGMCARSLRLPEPEVDDAGAGHPGDLAPGLRSLAAAARAGLDAETRTNGGRGPELRQVLLLLDRIAGLDADRTYAAFTDRCLRLAEDHRRHHPEWAAPTDATPAELLSAVLWSQAELDDVDSPAGAESRGLVALAARPATAFANLLTAVAAQEDRR